MDQKFKNSSDAEEFDVKLGKLKRRIKNTFSTRFAAAKRVKFNYSLANLTIIVLSLWAIAISFILTGSYISMTEVVRKSLEMTGVLLPVFVVVFSLMEGGDNYLRGYLLELNARQLRELSDEFSADIERVKNEKSENAKANLYEKYSKKYNDILERSPINHDDIDHLSKLWMDRRDDKKYKGEVSIREAFMAFMMLLRRQLQRAAYISFWFIPILPFLTRK